MIKRLLRMSEVTCVSGLFVLPNCQVWLGILGMLNHKLTAWQAGINRMASWKLGWKAGDKLKAKNLKLLT